MLSLRRVVTSHQLSRGTRSFAELVPLNTAQVTLPPITTGSSSNLKTTARVPVREDHGLYAFFRRKAGDNLVGEEMYEVVETPEDARMISGRPWEASELRLKSFKDLHTLWYVAAREQNLLATQREEARRMGVGMKHLQVPIEKVRNCRKTMARIKAVLNERRLAYEGALKLAEKQMTAAKERAVDQQVMDFQLTQREE